MKMNWRNPVMPQGADPWLIKDGCGGYYFTCTTGRNITLWHIASLDGFDKGEKKIIWMPPEQGPGSRDL